MQKRKLGNSDLEITPIGLGAWAMGGGDWAYGWGPQDNQESIDAIHRALDLGINWIDTAAVYGLGRSEQVVGHAIKGLSEKPYIFTKCELVWDEEGNITGSLKADSLRQEVEDSLRRLDVDVIDLYQIHWPNPDEDIEEGWQTLVDLKQEGKVRWIAVSNFSVAQMQRAMQIAPITSLQPPYSAIKTSAEDELLPFCGENNIGVIVYSPMQAGLLTGKMTRERIAEMPDNDWRKGNDEFQEPKLTKNLKLAAAMEDIAAKHNVTVPSVPIAWVLRRPEVTGAIVGARRPDQVEGIIGGGTLQLDDDDLAQLAAIIHA